MLHLRPSIVKNSDDLKSTNSSWLNIINSSLFLLASNASSSIAPKCRGWNIHLIRKISQMGRNTNIEKTRKSNTKGNIKISVNPKFVFFTRFRKFIINKRLKFPRASILLLYDQNSLILQQFHLLFR